MEQQLIDDFVQRKIKAKSLFRIEEISKNSAYFFVKKYHYLGDARFFAVYSYGLFCKGELVGVATYSNLNGALSLKGWFGIEDNSYPYILELSRLAMLPQLNGTNATSFLLGNSMRLLHKDKGIRAVTTLATSDRHIGSIYQVCNFKYYGLTAPKTDFFEEFVTKGLSHKRGATNQQRGVWVARPQKHRYAYIFDKTLKCLYEEQPCPKKGDTKTLNCCNGTNIVHDSRYNVDYLCPICNGWNNGLIIVNNHQKDKADDIRKILDEKELTYTEFVVNFFLKSKDYKQEMEEVYNIITNKLDSPKYKIDYDDNLFGIHIDNITYK